MHKCESKHLLFTLSVHACTVCVYSHAALLLHNAHCLNIQYAEAAVASSSGGKCLSVCECGLVTPHILEMLILHDAVIHSSNIDYNTVFTLFFLNTISKCLQNLRTSLITNKDHKETQITSKTPCRCGLTILCWVSNVL